MMGGAVTVNDFCSYCFRFCNTKLSDINECDSNPGCEQICNNLPGSFECACHPGLQIDTTNNKKCVGESALHFSTNASNYSNLNKSLNEF